MKTFGTICAILAILCIIAVFFGAHHQVLIAICFGYLSLACFRSGKDDRREEQERIKKIARRYE